MLETRNIENFLQRIGINEYSLTNIEMSDSGDYIKDFETNVDFDKVKKAIIQYAPYMNKITDNGLNFVEINDTILIRGFRTKVMYRIEKGENLGTVIKIMVKTVDAIVNGKPKQFLGFKALNNYIDTLVVSNEE